MKYVLGIDLGTQSTMTGLVNEEGRIVSVSSTPSNLIYPEKDAIEQDPEEMLDSIIVTTKDVIENSGADPSTIEGICIDGQMAGIMGVGRDGMAAIPYDSWLDARCGSARRAFLDYGEEKVIGLTGGPVTYTGGPKIVWWKENHPDTYADIYKFVQPGAYCAMRLCGLTGDEAFYDHTYLHFSGFADTGNKKWSDELIEGMGADASKFPRIVRPHDIIGKMKNDMARACGLLPGTPVVAGCGDTAASSFGAGITKPGLMFDVAGTASVLAYAVDKFVPDTEYKTIIFAPSVAEDLYTPMAYINGGGLCLKWFRDDVLGGELSYDDLDDLAEGVSPGSDNLMFVPHFTGRAYPNDDLVRGAFVGLQWTHGRGHMFRAIRESIAYEYAIYKDIMDKLVPDQHYENILGVGGGSVSRVFKQIKADVLGTPYRSGIVADTALLGCASIAGYGVGMFDDIAQITLSVDDYGGQTLPNSENFAGYSARKEILAGLYGSLHDTYGRLSNL